MNYNQPQLAEELAKRYVLGTMSGRARNRFKQLMMTHQSLQSAVWHWEQLLNPMTSTLEPIPPSKASWHKITSRLNWVAVKKKSLLTIFMRLSLGSALVVMLVTLGLNFNQPTTVAIEKIAVLQAEVGKNAWIVKLQGEQLIISAQDLPATDVNQDFELWMLPANGQSPISLGLMPKTGVKLVETNLLPKNLLNAGLAVSVEPKGGSTTGAPTGPVILATQWVKLQQV